MKRLLGVLLTGIALFAANQPLPVCAETESIDLKALAKKARPAVMLLVVSDANGKEIATGTGFLVSSDGKLITNFHVIQKADVVNCHHLKQVEKTLTSVRREHQHAPRSTPALPG